MLTETVHNILRQHGILLRRKRDAPGPREGFFLESIRTGKIIENNMTLSEVNWYVQDLIAGRDPSTKK